MKFDLPKNRTSEIKVIGVGGGGSNAVNHMYEQGITDVDFIVCNTDQQALDMSPVPHKIQLGSTLTEGRGAGSLPDVGKNAAIENLQEITDLLQKDTQMVFITAGMGGGTGTGAAPIIAEAAKSLGILTVGIVTMPFTFEGRKRKKQADLGIQEIKEHVDTLLIITNDKLREMYGNLKVAEAFGHADNILTTAAKGIAEVITRPGHINVDFEDVRTVMTNGGVALMGSGIAEGEDRASASIEKALASPLLNDNNIKGANYILLNISFGKQELSMDEIGEITDYIHEEAGEDADIIFGYGFDDSLGDEILVTLIATGFQSNQQQETLNKVLPQPKPENRVFKLDEEVQTTLTRKEFGFSNPKPESINSPINDDEIKIVDKKEEKEEKEDISIIQQSIELNFKVEESASEESVEEDLAEEAQEPIIEMEAPKEEKTIVFTLDDKLEEPTSEVTEGELEPEVKKEKTSSNIDPEERQRRAEERMMKLKNLSLRLRTPSGISDLENEPAYKRRNKKLSDVPSSEESQVSKYSLTENEDEEGNKKTTLRQNNSFLHDNVD